MTRYLKAVGLWLLSGVFVIAGLYFLDNRRGSWVHEFVFFVIGYMMLLLCSDFVGRALKLLGWRS